LLPPVVMNDQFQRCSEVEPASATHRTHPAQLFESEPIPS
jgi:hypothetical protein